MIKLLGLASTLIVLLQTAVAASSITQLSVTEIVERMLDAQANLVGYQSRVSVGVTVGRLRIPSISVDVELRRPAEMKVTIAGYTIKPNYPIFPDPMSFTGGQYELRLLEDIVYHKVEATPGKGAKSPYHIILWVDTNTYLPEKAKLTLPNGDYSILEAQYIKMGNKCWVTKRVTCQGSMLIKEILPIKLVGLALKLAKNPQDVKVEALFSEIKLL